jgi:hypothetical protein
MFLTTVDINRTLPGRELGWLVELRGCIYSINMENVDTRAVRDRILIHSRAVADERPGFCGSCPE